MSLLVKITKLITLHFISCWISSPYNPHRVWAVAGPALLVFAINVVIICLALKSAIAMEKKDTQRIRSSTKTKLSQYLSRIKGTTSLVILLGLTWVSFVLYSHEFGDVFSYVFIFLNGLQVQLARTI